MSPTGHEQQQPEANSYKELQERLGLKTPQADLSQELPDFDKAFEGQEKAINEFYVRKIGSAHQALEAFKRDPSMAGTLATEGDKNKKRTELKKSIDEIRAEWGKSLQALEDQQKKLRPKFEALSAAYKEARDAAEKKKTENAARTADRVGAASTSCFKFNYVIEWKHHNLPL